MCLANVCLSRLISLITTAMPTSSLVCYAPAGKAGEWKRTMAVLKSMRAARVQPDVYTYTSLIRACQSCGNRWQSAIEFFNQMQQAGLPELPVAAA